ncbi:MAG: Ig-like domain-containing protein [Spirochaetes bacterium]|nr:Ig-like domain-containing protein [Spirochaetota bacterium]
MNRLIKYRGDSYLVAVLLCCIIPFAIHCGAQAPSVNPNPVYQYVTPTDPGSLSPQVIGIYPEDGSTNIPVDTSIVIVFNKPIDTSTINPSTITITTVTSFTVTPAQDNRAIIIDITNPAQFAYNQIIDITVTTAVRDSDGNPLLTNYTSQFTTGINDSSYFLPKVVTISRFPQPGATNVSRDVGFVEVTFTKDMDSSTLTVANFGFSGPASSVTQMNPKTYRLTIDTLNYNTLYSVTLSGSIEDSDGNSLDLDGNHTWAFTTEPDPATIPLDISALWIDSATSDSITIQFVTTKPVTKNQCYAVYDINTPVTTGDTHVQEDTSSVVTTLHTVTIPSLSSRTLYYIRAGIDTNGATPVEILSTQELSVYTNTDNTNNSALTNASNDQNGLIVLQTNTASYAFWVSNELGNSDIYGQFFNSSGNTSWGANGSAIVNHTNTQEDIVAITDGFTDAIVLYREGSNVYAKMVFDNSGSLAFHWPDPANDAGDQGIAIATIQAGSIYSATLVFEQPQIIAEGIADMPDNGDATNLLYDADTEFSIYPWLTSGDLLLTNISMPNINWNSYSIANQSTTPIDIFQYVLKSSYGANLTSFDFFIADFDTSFSGTANSGTTSTEIRSSTDANFLLVNAGDIIYNLTNDEWGLAQASGSWNGSYYFIPIDRTLTNLSDGDTYTIYTNHSSLLTSEGVTNPLWDKDPSVPFNPGTTVLADDIVVNENNNSTNATYAQVEAVDLSKDTNYALRLTGDIMNNGDIYSIIRMPAGVTIQGVGYSTSVASFTVNDSNANFTGWSVNPGDIVFNIDANISAMVITVNSATQLTLSADIFTATNQKYIIYTKRAFLVSYIDTSDYVMAKVFNIADGSLLYSFAVCTDGINSNPKAICDEAGNAIIFYEKAGNIYAKKVTATGQLFTTWGTDADQASDPGPSILTGYSIVQIAPVKNTGGTGDVFLLAKNSAGNQFRLLRINSNNGTITFDSGNITGYNPTMVIDAVTGQINTAIIAYRNTHITGGITYYHIEARAYGGTTWGPIVVSSNTADYNCVQPVITMADTTSAADNFYIAWFDGRHYGTNGYSIYMQRYDATPSAQWAANGIIISFPTSFGYDYPLLLQLLYYNDGSSPYGALPLWLDYRDFSSTATNIYYQKISDAGIFQ